MHSTNMPLALDHIMRNPDFLHKEVTYLSDSYNISLALALCPTQLGKCIKEVSPFDQYHLKKYQIPIFVKFGSRALQVG